MQIDSVDKIKIGPMGRSILSIMPHIFDSLDLKNVLQTQGDTIKELTQNHDRVIVIGFGKASYTMYEGIRPYLSKRPEVSEVIVPEGMVIESQFDELRILRGTHPDTSAESEKSSSMMIKDIPKLTVKDLVIVLISGGGSALFEIPEREFSIDEVSEIGKCMMSAGADILEMNAMRGILSSVKSGKLARVLFPATVKSFIVSDVIGDDISVIASGPLCQKRQDPDFVKNTVVRYSSTCNYDTLRVTASITPELDSKYFQKVSNKIVLKNSDFVRAFYSELQKTGEDIVVFGSGIHGDVGDVAKEISAICRSLFSLKKNGFWFVFGGETTVNVRGTGMGGRNQELSLRFAGEMESDEQFLIMSIGTDGIDGRSPAMGAIIDSQSYAQIKKENVEAFLDNNDSYHLLSKTGSLIVTGLTGTNVSDIIVGYYDRKK